MNQNLKQILIFIAVFIFLLIAGFNSYKYWNKEDALIELSREEIKAGKENDSLKGANKVLEAENIRLKTETSQIENEKQTNYKTYKDKSKSDTQKPASEQGKILKELIGK